MISDIFFESANQDDLSKIEDLLKACDLPLDDVESHLPNFIVAKTPSRIIGCIGMEPYLESGLLRSLAVNREYRNQGIAQHLCGRLEQLARSYAVQDLYLLTVTAQSFFLKIGYKKIDRAEAPQAIKKNKQFTMLCPSTAALMKKFL